VTDRFRGGMYGLLAAALFGASTPLSKLLLPGLGPLMLASLLYLGAGAALISYRFSFGGRSMAEREARIRSSDLPVLAGIIVSGGVIGPVLMLTGLQRLPAVSAALLLNLEAPLTMIIAVLFFREHLERREAAAAALVVLGAAALAYRPEEIGADLIGVAAIAGACVSWGIDNNLTQRISVRDPTAVAIVKTMGAGAFTFALALLTGQPAPGGRALPAALAVGSVSYGMSIVLDTYALRHLGAAREAAFFATAPFAGALLSIPLLRELPAPTDYLAAALMAAGVILLLRARHSHSHTHEEMVHDHVHVHDEHHRHLHDGPVREPHAHVHRHESVTHQHPHISDAHHRHPHAPVGHSGS
jgi:drug/metabolite transporter (DMT)-like permease